MLPSLPGQPPLLAFFLPVGCEPVMLSCTLRRMASKRARSVTTRETVSAPIRVKAATSARLLASSSVPAANPPASASTSFKNPAVAAGPREANSPTVKSQSQVAAWLRGASAGLREDSLQPTNTNPVPRSCSRALARATPRMWPHVKALLTVAYTNPACQRADSERAQRRLYSAFSKPHFLGSGMVTRLRCRRRLADRCP
jgi:hypothetical protein